MTTFAIVGASLAGARAAIELREQGFDGRVVLIGSEPELPYERPPLSKEYLLGKAPIEKARVKDDVYYREHDIELLTATTVVALDPAGRLTLGDDSELAFDKLLLSTGAEPRHLHIPGADLAGVYYLRTVQDADELKSRLAKGGSVVVVGAGWIGSEVAACARETGLEVTVIDPLKLPNERLLGTEIGEFYRDVHLAHGVRFLLGDGVERFSGDGSVGAVHTASGQTVEADFVVVGVGAVPRTSLAEEAGLATDNGILVDASLRTLAPNIYAAGDVANAFHPFYDRRIRVEHWANALNQAPAAARSMLGQEVSYDRIPYFYSDQYDVGMEYSGYTTDWDEVVFRGPREGGEFVAFWLKDERVVAGMNVNVWDVNQHVQALIRSRAPIDKAKLTDLDTPLPELVP